MNNYFLFIKRDYEAKQIFCGSSFYYRLNHKLNKSLELQDIFPKRDIGGFYEKYFL